MKIIIVLLLFPVCSFAQQKGDNVIMFNANIPYNTIRNVLAQNGYTIDNEDSLEISATSQKNVKTAGTVKLLISKSDDQISVTAMMKPTDAQNDFEVIYYGAAKGTPLWDAWNEMNRMSAQIGTNPIYAKH